MDLSPSYFFDLDDFEHKVLFKQCTFVWEALSKIHSYLLSLELGHIKVNVPQGAYLVNPELISIAEGTTIEPGAFIQGPCVIGKNCQIRHGAYIRGGVISGDKCVIGHDTEIKNSILLNKAQAAHFAYIGDSILGNHVNLGAGTKCANLRLDHNQIFIHAEGQKIATGYKKLGAIIGDDCQLGCNCVTNPGTLMARKSSSMPCTNFGGFVPPKALIAPAASFTINQGGLKKEKALSSENLMDLENSLLL